MYSFPAIERNLDFPTDLAFTPNGDLYVACYGSCCGVAV